LIESAKNEAIQPRCADDMNYNGIVEKTRNLHQLDICILISMI